MTKLIVIESQELKEDQKVTAKQLEFIRDLMNKSQKLQIMYLDNLAQYVSSRLSKTAASKLITALLKHEEFEIRMLREYQKH